MQTEAMTAEPKYPVSQLTTSELARYRRELEHAVATLPDHATVRKQLEQRLAVVLAEVEERDRIRHANTPRD
jgi:hypothetical protein